jgi:CBS domain-containing protein
VDRPTTVRHCMSTPVITLASEMSVLDAARILIENDISGAPVVNRHGKLTGILTEKDCLKTTLSSGYHGEPGGKVSDYMSTSVEIVAPEMNLLDLADSFLQSRFHRFPVVSNDELVGFISRRDLLKAMFSLSWPSADKFNSD